jgi:hypothetical protein
MCSSKTQPEVPRSVGIRATMSPCLSTRLPDPLGWQPNRFLADRAEAATNPDSFPERLRPG